MIRILIFVAGLVTVFGALGTLDVDPEASLWVQGALAVGGLVMMCAAVPRREGQ